VSDVRISGLVSIVTPCLDGAAFLSEAIESVLAQTYPAVEYILVDGGSTDGSVGIARGYGERIRVATAIGSDQVQAINVGFGIARGEYVGFLNVDDTLEPGALAEAVALLAGNDAPFAYGEGRFVDDAGDDLGAYPVKDLATGALDHECCVCQPATLMRASAVARVGGLDDRYLMAFDYDLWFRLMRDAPAPVRGYGNWANARMHAHTKTARNAGRMYADVMELLRRHRDYVPFSWAHAYADHRLRPRDQFFDPPSGSLARTALTLAIGLWNNPRHPFRFAREFAKETLRLRRNALRVR
jgi:glycosyltransferase involved in cell wall biosynthesis